MRRVALATTTLALVAGWDEPFANIYRGLDTAGRVEAELNRSLADYAQIETPGAAERLVVRLLSDPRRSALILGNRLLVDARFLLTHKGLHHVEFVRSVLERSHDHPNFAYQWEWNADGFNSEDQLIREGCRTPRRMTLERVKPGSIANQKIRTPIPRLVIAKKYGYDQCGILMPNVYFDDLTLWGREEAALRREGLAKTERDPRVFWRGAIRRQPDCLDETGNFARLEAVALSAQFPQLFDVKCISCGARDFDKRPCPALTLDEPTRRVVRDGLPRGDHVAEEAYLNYKWLLNLPGSVSGSYSRNLNHLWASGSAVVVWAAPYVEWYYPALAEGKTHLEMSKTNFDAEPFARQLLNATLQKRLATRARAVHDEFVCADCLGNYWRLLVDRTRDRFGLRHVLEDPRSLRRVLARLDFHNFRLVEFNSMGHEFTRVRLLADRRAFLNLAKHALFRPEPLAGHWNAMPGRDWAAIDKESKSWTLTKDFKRYVSPEPTPRPAPPPRHKRGRHGKGKKRGHH